jgi:molybdenum cofactor cytidylyltransferase
VSAARHAVVLLAAGASSRLGQPKQLLQIDGVSLLRRAAVAALATQPFEAWAILGAEAERCAIELDGLAVQTQLFADWQQGMGASLACGLRALTPSIDGVLVVLCDQPALSVAHLQQLVTRWSERPESAVASAYADVLGVPAVLPRAWFADLENLRGDRGARDLLRERHDRVIPIPAPSLQHDIDEPQEARHWTMVEVASRRREE